MTILTCGQQRLFFSYIGLGSLVKTSVFQKCMCERELMKKVVFVYIGATYQVLDV